MPDKIIFFDAGGTLFRPWPSVGHVYARIALKHGVRVDPAVVEKAFHDKWHLRSGLADQKQTSEKIERAWWYALVRDVFHNLEAFRDFDAFFTELYDVFAQAECWRLFDDTLPALNALKARGHRLGIISNWDYRLFSIVKQLGLSDYFESVIASSAVGCSKPGAKIFEAALAAMDVKPEGCVHVGDSLGDDYEGAQKAGLIPVLIDRSARAYNDITRMKSLTELPDFLKVSKTPSPLVGDQALTHSLKSAPSPISKWEGGDEGKSRGRQFVPSPKPSPTRGEGSKRS